MNPWVLTCIAATSNGVLNTVPWGGSTSRAAAALSLKVSRWGRGPNAVMDVRDDNEIKSSRSRACSSGTVASTPTNFLVISRDLTIPMRDVIIRLPGQTGSPVRPAKPPQEEQQ